MSLHDHDRNRYDPYAPPTSRPYEMDSGGGTSKAGLIAALLLIVLFGFILVGGSMGSDPAADDATPAVTAPATDPAANTGANPSADPQMNPAGDGATPPSTAPAE
jgi:hypothetical protein